MKIEYPLTQHTPIIHFQSYQEGATLRASELKPKIDKFVLGELYGIDQALFRENEALIRENFSREKKPSRYKIRVAAQGNANIQRLERTPYFGDHPGVRHATVNVVIFSFDENLVRFIQGVLPYVLGYNNFGSRQSKGFGCFLPRSMDQTAFEELLLKKYAIFWLVHGGGNPFEVINRTYQLLKAGINHNGYFKSKLFEYMCQQNIRWEKRKIKQTLQTSHPVYFSILRHNIGVGVNRIQDCPRTGVGVSSIENCSAPGHGSMDHKYVRALLGLAEHNEYDAAHNRDNIAKIQIMIQDHQGEIERFRSPITFKFMNNRVYMLPEVIDAEIYDRAFDFQLRLKYGNGRVVDKGHLFTIKTPEAQEFDLEDFLSRSLPAMDAEFNIRWEAVERGQS